VDQIDAAATVDVEWSYPGKPKREAIYVGNIRATYEPYALGPTLPRAEEFEIDLTVSAAAKKGSARTVAERLFVLVAEFEEALLADPTLGGTVRTAFPVSSELKEGAGGDGGRLAWIDFRIQCRATLR
jgi:hypothetical protein